jgi:RimK family alpha-L-glutamate ligase
MKIAILHHDLEVSELKIKELLEEKGFEVELLDVREINIKELEIFSIILNRVYACVSKKDYLSIEKTLLLLKQMQEKEIFCIDSYETSLYNYSKFHSYKIMHENGILTPKTILINENEEINKTCEGLIKRIGFPIVLKRNTGGKGENIVKVISKQELKQNLIKEFEIAKKENYFGGFIAQEFIKSSKNYDCRISVFDDRVISCISRNLIKYKSEDNWLASISKGSISQKYFPSKEIINLAFKTTKVINAIFNSLDIIISDKGPIVIENNLTPQYIMVKGKNKNLIKLVEKISEKAKNLILIRNQNF